MSQMKADDLKVVKAIPGNDKCCDCGMKHPQWASVSFGNVFCLECSGVHRSLGVHISFVRSIAMDSWTPAQLAIMRTGGNDACNQYLHNKGVPKTASIKEKYDSDAAALYKLVIKARVDGKPEPTILPPIKNKNKNNNTAYNSNPTRAAPASAAVKTAGGGSKDPNGMERLNGESDAQYIARQTKLRESAKARMAAKFGNGGIGGKRTMGGVGSSPYSSSGGLDMNSLTGSLSSGFGTAASGFSSAFSFAKESVTSVEAKSVAKDVSSMGLGLWSAISSGAKEVANHVNMEGLNLGTDGSDDGLSALQDKVRREKSTRENKSFYSGFGSDTVGNANGSNGNTNANANANASKTNQTSIPVDKNSNSAAPLPGESDADYMKRQMRIREEATAKSTTIASSSASRTPAKAAVTKMKVEKDEDFFASFGA